MSARSVATVVAAARAGVLRFSAMRTLSSVLAAASIAALLSAAPAAHAQVAVAADSGMLVVFDQDTPVAHERFAWQLMGDSIVVSATARRTLIDDKGERHAFEKAMILVVDSRDLGLLRYLSNQDFQNEKVVRGLLPGDTALTYYTEFSGAGNAVRLTQPPGRLFVIDTPMFSLFDVLLRSLAGKEFETRRVQLLAMGADTLTMPLATVTRAKVDTLRMGTRRVPARHYTLEDPSVRFEMWADANGRLLRLSHPGSGMSVERAPAAPAAAKPRLRPRSTGKR